MCHNPYTQDLNRLKAKLKHIEAEREKFTSQREWFQSFNLENEHHRLMAARLERDSEQRGLDDTSRAYETRKARLSSAKERAVFGIDPRDWFSSERAIAKRLVEELQPEVDELLRKCRGHKARIKPLTEVEQAAQAGIDRYRAVNVLELEATLNALSLQSEKIQEQITPLQELSDEIESLVADQLQRLNEYKRHAVRLENDIQRAMRFEEALKGARNSYERAMVHQSCTNELGDGSPGQVLQDRRRKLNSVRSSIEKLEKVIQEVVKSVQREVRAVILDGNNLCNTQDGKFIGLIALDALVPKLAEKYDVTLIFDPGIRGKLRVKDSALKSRFPSAAVYVMPSKIAADETILDAAQHDEHTYVISNDRFVDFPHKAAVSNDRILKHVILNDVVKVHGVSITVPVMADVKH